MTKAKITFNPEELRSVLRIHLLTGGTIPAGAPEAKEQSGEYVDLNEHLIIHPDDTHGLTVFGDSMDEDEIHHGDLILVDRIMQPRASSIVVVDVDGELTVKRFSLVGGRLFLVPGNKSFKQKEVFKEQRCEVWGVVTYVIHKKM